MVKINIKEERNTELVRQFNEGRLNADKKWVTAIDRRIAELELQVGIPELRRLRKERYSWNNPDPNLNEDKDRIKHVRRG